MRATTLNSTWDRPSPRTGLLACWPLLGCLALPLAALAEDAPQKSALAVVDVSEVFLNYRKVLEVNKQMEVDFEPRKKALVQERLLIKKAGEMLQSRKSQDGGKSEFLFDQEQHFEKMLFQHAKKTRDMEQDMAQSMRKSMREVLNEIRAAINQAAKQRGITLVLRAADAPNMEVFDAKEQDTRPPDNDKPVENTLKEILKPRTMVDLIGRFKQNPVLYGADAVDITKDVLKVLNDQFEKKPAK